MGLQRLKLKKGASDRILQLAIDVGMDYLRTTCDTTGSHYWFKKPKQGREYSITLDTRTDNDVFLIMGVSPRCFALAKRLEDEKLLIPY
jgi:hypothetical protein